MDLDIVGTRTPDNKVKLSFFSEDTLRYILGSYYNNCHGLEINEKKWKNILKKLSTKLEIAIKRNITTDDFHREQIESRLNSLNRKIDEKINSDPDIIIALVGLCFELLGELPDNTKHKHASQEKYFDLNAMRSLHFIQTNQQKVQVIFKSAKFPPFSDYYSYDDLIGKFYTEFGLKPHAFMEWYKLEYPNLYAKIF